MRQASLAAMLASRGYECAVWGLGGCEVKIGDAIRCDDWKSAIGGADAVILPLPASTDGVRISCPLCNTDGTLKEETYRLKLNTLLDATDAPILGGKLTASFTAAAAEREKKIHDYYDSEELKIRNAVPTAEGAMVIAMNELPVTVSGCRAAVTGYGRVAKALSSLLCCMGADVTVAARSGSDLAWIGTEGFKALRIKEHEPDRGLSALTDGYDVIFNTVPARLFDSGLICAMPEKTLIIDLSSAPGGVDFRAAREKGLNVIWALSLPGKYAPVTAGRIIGECVIDYLEREGIT